MTIHTSADIEVRSRRRRRRRRRRKISARQPARNDVSYKKRRSKTHK